MAAHFTLNPTLEADTFFVRDLELSTLRLMNDSRYPWLILVPKVAGAEELFDLDDPQRTIIMKEVNKTALLLQELLAPTKINVAALGNQVRQLHIHVIARYASDAAWPNPVWGGGKAISYEGDKAEALITKIRAKL